MQLNRETVAPSRSRRYTSRSIIKTTERQHRGYTNDQRTSQSQNSSKKIAQKGIAHVLPSESWEKENQLNCTFNKTRKNIEGSR